DPALGTFVATAPMSTAREHHSAIALGAGTALIAGGYNGGTASSAEIFDPTGAGSFAPTGSLKTARFGHVTVALPSGNVLVAGGRNNVPLASAELFDGVGTFAATGSMTSPRTG